MSIDGIRTTDHHGIDDPRSLDKAQEARRKDGPVSPQQTPKPAQGDLVALSSKAKEIGRLSQLAGDSSGDRTARISQIREAIQNGTYRVSGEDIANKIIEAHKK